MIDLVCSPVVEEHPFHIPELPDCSRIETIRFDDLEFPVSELFEEEGLRIFFHCLRVCYKKAQFEVAKHALDVFIFHLPSIREDVALLELSEKEVSNFLLHLLPFKSEIITRSIDVHFMLTFWSFAIHFLPVNSKSQLGRTDCEVVLIDGLVLLFEKYREVFKCGCIQTELYKFYKQDSGVRFCSTFQKVFSAARDQRCCTENENKEFKQIPHCSTSAHFEFFVELLRESTNLGVIEPEELKMQRLPQLLAMLTEVPTSDFSTATLSLLGLLDNLESLVIVDKRRRKLVNDIISKVFQFYDDATDFDISTLNFTNETLNRTKMMAPLVLLDLLLSEQNSWSVMRQQSMRAISERLEAGLLTPPVFLVLSRVEDYADIFSMICEHLKKKFQNPAEKRKVLETVAFLETKCSKEVTRLSHGLQRKFLLQLDLSKDVNSSLFMENCAGMTEDDLKKADFESLLKSLKSAEKENLFGTLTKLDVELTNVELWRDALNTTTNASTVFVVTQLKRMLRRRSTEGRAKFQKFVEVIRDPRFLPKKTFLVAVCTEIFDIRDECRHVVELSDVNFYLPFALLAYCLCEKEESTKALQNVWTLLKLSLSENEHFWDYFDEIGVPATMVTKLLGISTIINDNKLSFREGNTKFWMKDPFVKHLTMILPENEKKLDSDLVVKNQAAHLLGELMASTSTHLQEMNSTSGKFADTPYVRLSKCACDGLVKVYHGTGHIENLAEISLKVMRSMCTIATNNIQTTIFTVQRVRSLLTTVRSDRQLVGQLVSVLDDQKCSRMRVELLKNKDFVILLDSLGITL